MLAAAVMQPPRRSRAEGAVVLATIGSALACAFGLTVVVGWVAGIPALTRLSPIGPNVKTNAGVAIACAGLANIILLQWGARFWPRSAARVLAALCLAIGGATLSEHLVGWDLGIDQLLATEPPGALATASPNRVGPPGSTAFLMIGLALLLIDVRHPTLRRIGQGASLCALAISLLPLVGYAFGLTALYSVARYTGIALSTTVSLLVLTLSIIVGRPHHGLARPLCRDDESGTLVRKLFAEALVLTFGVGWLLAYAYHAQVLDAAFVVPVMTLLLIAGLTAIIWRASHALGLALDQRDAIGEALARSAASLREADAQKNAFLATLSHELRNPLAPIRFALDLLDGPPDQARRAQQTIGRQVTHLARLVDDLLDLTRLTHNKVQLQRRAVSVADALRDAADAVRDEVRRAEHTLDVVPPAQVLWVDADPDRLLQMLVNLLTNAVRYTSAGGRITIGAHREADEVCLWVRDTGIGIAPGDLERVFQMFVQVDGRQGGLGIGLALVKGLAELHGGHVAARSDGVGTGAEFRVRLRCAAAPREVPSTPGTSHGLAAKAPPAAARSILVVDDNQDAATMLRDVLVLHGHTVRLAHDGDSALLLAFANTPDVALLDLGLPDIDGFVVARRLRNDPATRHMFLVAVTGWGQDEDRRRAFDAGFDAHVTKPADVSTLLALIESGRPGKSAAS